MRVILTSCGPETERIREHFPKMPGTLIVCGMMTRRCADTAVRSAADHAYQVKPAKDACAAMDLNLNGGIIPADTVRKALIAALDGAFAAII